MYSILLVEDERLERMVLKAEIEKHFNEISVVYEAENGIEALRIAQYQHPDIMLVDINIPGISGLDLIKTLRGHGFTGEIIITTAYDRFAYIQQALSLGVVGYVLKPILLEELAQHLCKCFELIEREQTQRNQKSKMQETMQHIRSYAQSYLIRDILSGNIPQNLIQSAYSWPPSGELQACLLCWQPYPLDSIEGQHAFLQESKMMLQPLFHILAAVEQNKVIILLQARVQQDTNFLYAALQVHTAAIIRRLNSIDIQGSSLYVGPLCTTYRELIQSCNDIIPKANYSDCQNAREKVVLPQVMRVNSLCPSKERIKLRQKWVLRIREGHVKRIIAMVKRKLTRPGAFWPGALLFLDALYQFDPLVKTEEVFDLFCTEKPFEALESWLSKWLKNSAKSLRTSSLPDIQKNIIHHAMIMIKVRFAEEISEDEIAQELGICTSYFSRLFKQMTGENFITTIKRMRISHAKDLLDSGERNIDSIIAKCGYTNRKYFYEAFKKETGETITTYLLKRKASDKESL